MVVFHDQTNYKEPIPVGLHKPSPQINATGKEDDPQWLKDFMRDGVRLPLSLPPSVRTHDICE
jgi:hypothetical protein